jgi:hypothetical protein
MTTEPRRSEDKGGIWQGIAAVITAVGGFLIVLHQIGYYRISRRVPPQRLLPSQFLQLRLRELYLEVVRQSR